MNKLQKLMNLGRRSNKDSGPPNGRNCLNRLETCHLILLARDPAVREWMRHQFRSSLGEDEALLGKMSDALVTTGKEQNYDSDKFWMDVIKELSSNAEMRQRLIIYFHLDPLESLHRDFNSFLGFYLGDAATRITHIQMDHVHVRVVTGESIQCRLTKIIEAICRHCPNLEELNAANNEMTCLTPYIGQLRRLKTLNLSANRMFLEGIPYTITNCQQLQRLILTQKDKNHYMRSLPSFLLEMPNLRRVEVDDGNVNKNREIVKTMARFHPWGSKYEDGSLEIESVYGFMDEQCRFGGIAEDIKSETLQQKALKSCMLYKINLLSELHHLKVWHPDLLNCLQFRFPCFGCTRLISMHARYNSFTFFARPFSDKRCLPFKAVVCSKQCVPDLTKYPVCDTSKSFKPVMKQLKKFFGQDFMQHEEGIFHHGDLELLKVIDFKH